MTDLDMNIRAALHPELRPHIDNLLELVEGFEVPPSTEEFTNRLRARPDLVGSYYWAYEKLNKSQRVSMGGSVFTMPLLDPQVCNNLIAHGEHLAKDGGWARNPCEPEEFQIPEIVLAQRSPATFKMLEGLIRYINVFHAILYQRLPQSVSSIQFTKYTPETTNQGNWHHDLDSDFTVVVSLNPDLFEGGGTEVISDPMRTIQIPPLPAGHALIFNGKMIRHRGMEVTKGSRYLLTYWLNSECRE